MDEYKHLFINSRKKQNNYINRAISPSPKKSAKTLSIEEEHLLKTAIEEYIKNQLQEDIAADQISLKEYIDPFTGSKN